MKLINFDARHSGITITADMQAEAQRANRLLHTGEGAGNDFLGWVNLPSSISDEHLSDIKRVAERLRSKAEVVVCIGIGGSYLGAKAVLEAMTMENDLLVETDGTVREVKVEKGDSVLEGAVIITFE